MPRDRPPPQYRESPFQCITRPRREAGSSAMETCAKSSRSLAVPSIATLAAFARDASRRPCGGEPSPGFQPAAVTRVPVLGACVARDPVRLPLSTIRVMSEPAENSDGTVRNLRPWKPGQSGNPGGRPKGLAKTVREVCGGSPLLLAHVLLEIALDPKAHKRDRIAATRELLDRGWGKAVGYADIEGADPLGHDEVAQEIREIAEALEQERLSHSQ